MQHFAQVALTALVVMLALVSLRLWWQLVTRSSQSRPLAEYEPRPAVPWSIWDVLLLLFLTSFVDAIALGVVVPSSTEKAGGLSVAVLAAASGAHLIWLALTLAYLSNVVVANVDDLGFNVGSLRYDARVGGRMFLAAVLPVYGLQLALTFIMPSKHPLARLAEEQPSFGVLFLATISAVVIAPLFEEFLFRVLLQGWLEKLQVRRQVDRGIDEARPGVMPIVVTSLLFGLAHWGYGPDPVALFVLALFLGYAYRQTHRIFAPLAMHACVNALGMLDLWVTFFVSG